MQTISIEKIQPYGKNAKRHPTKQVKQIARSIEEFGFNQPIVVDKEGVIIVGHGRYEAARLLKLKEVPVLYVKGLTQKQVDAYRLADNKLNESDWDMGLVVEELKLLDESGYDITLTGFDRDLLEEEEERDNNVPMLPKKILTRKGDIYELGDHRLMCGDSTDIKDFEKLMDGKKADMVFTDPPYNVNYLGGNTNNEREGIENDKMLKSDFFLFLKAVCKNINEHCNGAQYICMSSSETDSLKRAFEDTGGHWQSFIIWVKNNFTLGRSDYQNTYEPILYGWSKKVKKHYFIGDRNIANVWEDLREVKTEFDGKHTTINFQGFKVKIAGKVEKGEVVRKKQHTDIWRHNKPLRSKEHPTMKPVSLVTEAIFNSRARGGLILDPFLGSGTTLIAAEKAERVCYGMELDPAYCDVVVSRWEEFTKLKAKKI